MSTREPARWLILDVDDTLVDTFGVGWRKCVEVARMLDLDPPDLAGFTARYGTLSFAGCVAAAHPGVDLGRYAAAYDTLADRFPAEPIGDVRAAVSDAVSAGFRLAVLTNGPGRKTVRKLAAAGLDPDGFVFVRHADNTSVAKPAPASFARVCADHGVDTRRAWYVSDQPADWVGAVAAGLRPAAVVGGSVRPGGAGLVPQLMAATLEGIVRCLAALPPEREPDPLAPHLPVTAVSFDAGFTLLEHVRTPAAVLAGVLPDAGFGAPEPLGPDTWTSDERIAAGLGAYYLALAGPACVLDPGAIRAVVDEYTSTGNWRATPGAAAALGRVRAAGLTAGVLSNWQTGLPTVLRAAGLLGLVDPVVTSAGCGAAKPDPAAFGAFAAAAGVDLAGVLHIGDDPDSDGAGALSAGCRALLHTDGWESSMTDGALWRVTA